MTTILSPMPCYHAGVRLILASASPRRADLLSAAGFLFDVRPVEVDERPLEGEAPREYVVRLAIDKARACPVADPADVVVAADTTVVIDGRILAKPIDADDARRMLRALSGRDHEVLTGVAVRYGPQLVSAVEASLVRFLPLVAEEIEWYLGSGEPFDKAGAYAVQGRASRFIERVEGSHANVVGLPVARLYRVLAELVGRAGVRAVTA
jgi:septum formation protein